MPSDLSFDEAVSSQNPLTLRVVSTQEGWQALQPHWEELLKNSEADAVFLSWDWLDAWLSVYGPDGQWVILVAEDRPGHLIGIAPMMIDYGAGIPGRWIRRLLLLGQKADTASEYLDWILRRGHERTVAEAFIRYILEDLAGRWDILYFEAMREDSLTIPYLAAAFEAKGMPWVSRKVTTAPYVSLPASWDEFLASRSSTFRQRWKKFHREHAVTLRKVGQDFTVAEGMARLRELNALRWGDQRQSFLSPKYVRFHDEVAARFHQRDELVLVFLEVDGQMIAGRYDFAYGGKGWCFQGGWLPEQEKLRPGRTMMAWMLRTCIERGLHEYDFLGGAASYKGEWSHGERGIVNHQARNPASLRGWLYEQAKKVQSLIRPKRPAAHAEAGLPPEGDTPPSESAKPD